MHPSPATCACCPCPPPPRPARHRPALSLLQLWRRHAAGEALLAFGASTRQRASDGPPLSVPSGASALGEVPDPGQALVVSVLRPEGGTVFQGDAVHRGVRQSQAVLAASLALNSRLSPRFFQLLLLPGMSQLMLSCPVLPIARVLLRSHLMILPAPVQAIRIMVAP